MHLKAQLVVANNQVESLTQMNSEQEQRIEQLKTLNTSLQVRSRERRHLLWLCLATLPAA